MIRANYIRLNQRDWNTPIFRFITIDYLVELFVQRQNTLVAPLLWDDPFENILESVKYKRESDGMRFEFSLRDRAYGQCWTLRPNHDAAWRCYLPNKKGAQLTSTIRKLYISLQNSKDYIPKMSCFIGRVAYYNEAWFSNARIARYFKKGGTQRHVETLLWKRDAFRWEKEIRLLYLDPRAHTHGGLFRFAVDPCSFISQITLDPRMTKQLADSYASFFQNLGYGGPILQSSLYRTPNMEITI